jgi:nitrogenase molybdenum-cofactor synthesis protein NifE
LANSISPASSGIQPLLDELGIRVLGSLSGDGRFAEIQTLHRAQANMLVCSRALINVARRWSSATARRGLKAAFTGSAPPPTPAPAGGAAGDDDLRRRTEALIAREEQAAEQALAPWREQPRAQSAALYRRREILVGGLGPAGFGHDRGGDRHAQIHRRG